MRNIAADRRPSDAYYLPFAALGSRSNRSVVRFFALGLDTFLARRHSQIGSRLQFFRGLHCQNRAGIF
jgi:hypothetical protein